MIKKYYAFFVLLLIVSPIISLSSPAQSVTTAASAVNIWWPTDQKVVTGLTPFKADLPGYDITQYDMYWQVDNGTPVVMNNSYTDYPHKEAMVDLSNWNWKGTGPYVLTFTAKQNGNQIGQQTSTIYTGTPSTPTVVVAPTPTVAPVPANAALSTTPVASLNTHNPLANQALYVNKNSPAALQALQWKNSRPQDAAVMSTVAQQSTASWFGNWNSSIQNDVSAYVTAAASQGQVPVLVAYNIPGRDCGSYSAGGANGSDAYKQWIQSFAAGIGNKKAAVILEPDALAGMDCLSSSMQADRVSLIKNAVTTLKANANTIVYVDAGNSNWQSADTMAARLTAAGIGNADGFSLNVSNFYTNDQSIAFGTALSQKLNGKHFVIDTSRNGNGDNGQWCNPSGRALGVNPTTNTGNTLIDAFLWIKTPGESDGTCNGGPSAGTWWPEYLLDLVKNKK